MDVEELVGEMQSKSDEGVVSTGECLPMLSAGEVLPTGIFPLDLAMGGGFPRGKIHIIYGPESSGKTNIALKMIALEQGNTPDEGKNCVFVDTENSFDPLWASRLGVELERLVVIRPTSAEEAIDMVVALFSADNLSVLVLDSIADLLPNNEAISTASKAQVGGNSALVSKLMKKLIASQLSSSVAGRYPTFIGLNQIRHKIGVMFGNPEYMPGGNLMRFATNMIVRVSGKDVLVKGVSDTMPVLKHTDVNVRRWKRPIVCPKAEYDFVTIAHSDLPTGGVEDWKTVSTYLREYGWLGRAGKTKWRLFEEEFPTLTACRDSVYSDPGFEQEVKRKIIARAVVVVNGLEAVGG